MVLNPHIVLNKNKFGYGLFASQPIEEGEVIWTYEDEEISQAIYIAKADIRKFDGLVQDRMMRFQWECNLTEITISSWLKDYVFGEIDFLSLDNEPDISDLWNHSCDPNSWYLNDNMIVARRRIEAGEDVAYDYATDRAGHFDFKCLCGSPLCRGIIRKTDFELPELRQRYGNHFRTLILQAFDDPEFARKLKESFYEV